MGNINGTYRNEEHDFTVVITEGSDQTGTFKGEYHMGQNSANLEFGHYHYKDCVGPLALIFWVFRQDDGPIGYQATVLTSTDGFATLKAYGAGAWFDGGGGTNEYTLNKITR